jgi:hypothetical protein
MTLRRTGSPSIMVARRLEWGTTKPIFRYAGFTRSIGMTANRGHPWSDEDIAKLKSLAGRLPARDIADKMGRSLGAVITVAARMKLSLRTRLDSNRNSFAKMLNRPP